MDSQLNSKAKSSKLAKLLFCVSDYLETGVDFLAMIGLAFGVLYLIGIIIFVIFGLAAGASGNL